MNTLLKKIAVGFTIIAALSSCNNNNEAAQEQQRQQLIRQDSLLHEYVQILQEIDADLDEIRDKQGVIILGPESNVDENVPTQEQIRRNIEMIKFVLDAKQHKMVQLEQQLSSSNRKIASLQAISRTYDRRIAAAQSEIDTLHQQLHAARTSRTQMEIQGREMFQTNALLLQENNELHQQVSHQQRVLNTAWYACGTKKELVQNKILEGKGSLLAINAYRLTGNWNTANFVTVNIQETKIVPIQGKKARVITVHPTDSYRMITKEKGIIHLEILRPDSFWSVSKYLVIQTV